MLIDTGPIPEDEYKAKIVDVRRGPNVDIKNRPTPTIEVEFELDIDRLDNTIVERILAFPKSYKLRDLFEAAIGNVPEKLDANKLLNKWITAVVTHNNKDNKTYANITEFKYIEESKESREAAELFEDDDEELEEEYEEEEEDDGDEE